MRRLIVLLFLLSSICSQSQLRVDPLISSFAKNSVLEGLDKRRILLGDFNEWEYPFSITNRIPGNFNDTIHKLDAGFLMPETAWRYNRIRH